MQLKATTSGMKPRAVDGVQFKWCVARLVRPRHWSNPVLT
jgi:hypothetical protein